MRCKTSIGTLVLISAALAPPLLVGDTVAKGVGQGEEIDADAGKIVIHHEAIDELNWPAMTMPLPLASRDLTEAIAPGDHIRFILGRDDEGGYRIVELEKMD